MKKIVFALVALLLTLVLLVGCAPKRTTTIQITGEEEGEEATVTVESGVSGEWCSPGANWKLSGAEASSQCKVVGPETSGEYQGLCHIRCSVASAEEQANIEYWIDKSGHHGYMEMNINGQKFKQEWSG